MSFLIGGLLAVLLFPAVSCGDRQTRENPNVELSETPQKQNTIISANRPAGNRFEQNLPAGLVLPEPSDFVLSRILKDYGSIFVARGGVIPPPKIMFENAEECAAWQATVSTRRENFGVVNVELQDAAMRALIAARDEMRSKNLKITARGTWAGRRDYADTVKIWLTRVVPGLAFWTQRGKISPAEAARIRSLAAPRQVAEILRLEAKNIFFSKDFSKSILYSATAPGCSQHLSMLAIDLNENANPTVRRILAKHGWYQTVVSDLPHFTFLGAAEEELPNLGLKKISKDNRVYWIPE